VQCDGVPAAPAGNAQLSFALGGAAGSQTLYLAVGIKWRRRFARARCALRDALVLDASYRIAKVARRAVETGRLHSEEEAVQEALALWEERERRLVAFLTTLASTCPR
jgi:hypothetical protein